MVALLSATPATSQEQLLLGSGCYTQAAIKDFLGLSEEEGTLLMLQYLQDGLCAQTVTTQSDWNKGAEIRDTGIWVAYSRVYNWATTPALESLGPKQVMYFDADSASITETVKE